MGCTGSQCDQNLAFFSHFKKHLHVLLIGHPAGDYTNHGLRYLQLLPVTKLTVVFMIHQNRNMHQINFCQQIKKSFAGIQNRNFTTGTGMEPFLCYTYSHDSLLCRLRGR